MKTFTLEVPSSHYGITYYVVVEADTLQEAREKMKTKFPMEPPKQHIPNVPLDGAELIFDENGVTELLGHAW